MLVMAVVLWLSTVIPALFDLATNTLKHMPLTPYQAQTQRQETLVQMNTELLGRLEVIQNQTQAILETNRQLQVQIDELQHQVMRLNKRCFKPKMIKKPPRI